MNSEQSKPAGQSGIAESVSGFRAPQPKPGVHIAPPSLVRRLRRSIGGTVAYLASWWRY